MITETIKYKDYDGVWQTEVWNFYLGEADIAEMAISRKGFDLYLKAIVESDDTAEVMKTFKEILSMSVGKRSEDGRRFIKSEDITNDFMQTPAYGELLMTLLQDAAYAAEFVKGLLPSDLAERLKAAEEKSYTQDELLGMSDEEFERAVGVDPKGMTREHLVIAMARKNRAAA